MLFTTTMFSGWLQGELQSGHTSSPEKDPGWVAFSRGNPPNMTQLFQVG